MRFRWPTDTVFNRRILEVEQDRCALCCRRLHVCDHRPHRIFTLQALGSCSANWFIAPPCPARRIPRP